MVQQVGGKLGLGDLAQHAVVHLPVLVRAPALRVRFRQTVVRVWGAVGICLAGDPGAAAAIARVAGVVRLSPSSSGWKVAAAYPADLGGMRAGDLAVAGSQPAGVRTMGVPAQ